MLPAIAPSCVRALPSFTVTGIPAIRYSPSGQPVASMESVISTSRSRLSVAASLTISGAIWNPSQISSQEMSGDSSAAQTAPPARWCRGGRALYRCVTAVAPSANARIACS